MAWLRLPAPGTLLGPCEAECHHIDCRAARVMAVRGCTICGELLGYERAITDTGEAEFGVVHQACLERALAGTPEAPKVREAAVPS